LLGEEAALEEPEEKLKHEEELNAVKEEENHQANKRAL
jgi:hypothetical protein